MKHYCIVEDYLYHYAEKSLRYSKYDVETVRLSFFNDSVSFIDVNKEILLVVSNNHLLALCLLKMHDLGVEQVYIEDLYAIDRYERFIDEEGDFCHSIKKVSLNKPYLVHIETHINDKCNLNCKACNNYAPWVNEEKLISIDSLKSDIESLSKQFKIGRLFLLGGEPLLQPEHAALCIKVARERLKDTEIRLLTNGLLIEKMQDWFWECVHRNDVIISITLYKPTMRHLQSIKEILFSHRIKFVIGSEVETFDKRLTLRPYENAEYNSSHCGSSGCHFFGNGIYTKCPDARTISFMGNEYSEIASMSIKQIDKIIDGWNVCRELEEPSDMCRFCSIERMEHITWEPSAGHPKKSDWFIDDREIYIQKMKRKVKRFLQRKIIGENDGYEIAIWGAGRAFNDYYNKIKDWVTVRYLIDQDPDRQNYVCMTTGLEPLNISSINNRHLIVIICVDNPIAIFEICEIISDDFEGVSFHVKELLDYAN